LTAAWEATLGSIGTLGERAGAASLGGFRPPKTPVKAYGKARPFDPPFREGLARPPAGSPGWTFSLAIPSPQKTRKQARALMTRLALLVDPEKQDLAYQPAGRRRARVPVNTAHAENAFASAASRLIR